MNSKFYVALYSITLVLSSSLLFVVQPMFSKMVLPLLGGTPQVWNTAMVFFQVSLLAGYAYAHGITKFLNIKSQGVLHLILLILFFFVLPISLTENQVPSIDHNPTLWQLTLMLMTMGGPFFIISASAPMLQRWFSFTDHKDADNPYFLYGASNLGSVSALLLYPIIIEPNIDLDQQSYSWMYGYIILIVLIVICCLSIWKIKLKKTAIKMSRKIDIITFKTRSKWIILSFIPSSLMLGVTTYITTNIASAPLIWIIPLLLFIITFIIVFSRKPIISESTASNFLGYLIIYMFINLFIFGSGGLVNVPIHMGLFFFAALTCHSLLASSKPSAEHLTEFYLMISIGGALGGVFNALIAPNIFIVPIEYAIALAGAVFMRLSNVKQEKIKAIDVMLGVLAAGAIISLREEYSMTIKILLSAVTLVGLTLTLNKRWVFASAVLIPLLISTPGNLINFFTEDLIFKDRNFFGVVRVMNNNNQRIFIDGTTIHGTQFSDKKDELKLTSYYTKTSPISDLFEYATQEFDEQKVAVLGLGVGVTACYYKKGRRFDFYEINPATINIAENPKYFSFLSNCGSPYEIYQGDARIELKKRKDHNYDFIFADAYSSDNIPIHLITREAVALYLKKLNSKGILGFNISNSYVDIEPVLTEIANSFNIKGYSKLSKGALIEGTNIKGEVAQAFAFARNKKQEEYLISKGWKLGQKRKGVGLWTDKFSNIITVLGNISQNRHVKELEE